MLLLLRQWDEYISILICCTMEKTYSSLSKYSNVINCEHTYISMNEENRNILMCLVLWYDRSALPMCSLQMAIDWSIACIEWHLMPAKCASQIASDQYTIPYAWKAYKMVLTQGLCIPLVMHVFVSSLSLGNVFWLLYDSSTTFNRQFPTVGL